MLALETRSRAKALKYSQVIHQRLDEQYLPIRLDALGLYHAFSMLLGTVALIEHYVKDFDHCEDLKVQIEPNQLLPKLWKLR